MQTAVRKVYISILVTILCLITVGATTYAWVGILTNSRFENFDINLQVSNLTEYGIELSLTGEEESFSTEIDGIELKKVILKNCGYSDSQFSSDTAVENLFIKLVLDQCTVNPAEDNTLDFIDMDGKTTNKYFKFDLYFSTYRVYESENPDSSYLLDIFLQNNMLNGTLKRKSLINEYVYPSGFVNQTGNIVAGTKISSATVDSAFASRVAIQKYDVVEKYDTSAYDSNSKINDLIIYQGGTQDPTYDAVSKVYSFGGILPTAYNLAAVSANTYDGYERFIVPDWAINRGDVVLDNTTNHLIDSAKETEQIGINQMMKTTVYFWFEGWDADCFEIINKSPVTLNLTFSTIQMG